MAGNLPGDVKYTNVDAMRDELVGDPARLRYAVVAVDTIKVTTRTDDGETTPTLRIRRIELAETGDDAAEVEKLLNRLSEARLGALPLAAAGDDGDGDQAGE
jgi:hypothetical protein